MIQSYKLFNNSECEELIDWIESYNKDWEVFTLPTKRCKKKSFGKSLLYYDRIKLKVKELLDIDADSEVGCLKYETGDSFSVHSDAEKDNEGFHDDWIWNVNIQLTSPHEYEGGELIYKDNLYKIDKGNIYIYRSNELHGVKLVEGGIRYCIVFYIRARDVNMKKTLI